MGITAEEARARSGTLEICRDASRKAYGAGKLIGAGVLLYSGQGWIVYSYAAIMAAEGVDELQAASRNDTTIVNKFLKEQGYTDDDIRTIHFVDDVGQTAVLLGASTPWANRPISFGKASGSTVVEPGISSAEKPYSTSRPAYTEGQVDEVWERAKGPDGLVRDPNTQEVLSWDKFKSRFDQWHMGHKPGKEYSTLHRAYLEGRISKEEFLREYRNPDNYIPEVPRENMSHKWEKKR